MLKTPPGQKLASHQLAAAPLADHAQMEIDRSIWFKAPENIQKYRDYAAGKHNRQLSTEQSVILKGILDNDFCDNVAGQIISEAADRIELLRWTCTDEAVQTFLSDFYIRSNVPDIAGEAHYCALRDGNFALSLSWDERSMSVKVNRELWWDGMTGVFVGEDIQGNAMYAFKEWQTPYGIRRVVWLDDRIERYIQEGAAWVPYALPIDNGMWPIGWSKLNNDPLHIPVIHFANSGRGGVGAYGASELEGGVLGFQDQINDLQYAMSAAGRFTGYQMYTLTGAALAVDPTTKKKIPLNVAPGQLLHSEDKDAAFGYLPAGDLSEMINLYREKLRSVSRMTRTPLHSITGGDWPSGEALLRAEMPAVNKATRQIHRFEAAWREVAHRATEISNTFNRTSLDESDLISAIFSPADRRDPLSKSVIVNNLGDKISEQEALRIMGYSEADAQKIVREKRDEELWAQENLATAFSRGQTTAAHLPGKSESDILEQKINP